jgi:hypothetical protein
LNSYVKQPIKSMIIIVMTFLVWECYGSPKISIKFVKIRQNLRRKMFWQGALPRKFANFKVQNEECHYYDDNC